MKNLYRINNRKRLNLQCSSLIHARTLYYLAKALPQHYPSPTLYGDHSFDVSPKNTEAFAAQEHLQEEIY